MFNQGFPSIFFTQKLDNLNRILNITRISSELCDIGESIKVLLTSLPAGVQDLINIRM